MNRLCYFLFCFGFLYACQSGKVYNRFESNRSQSEDLGELEYSIYLIGDVGADTLESSAALRSLRKKLNASPPKKTGVVFLGDNIYPEGLHKKKHFLREEDESRINAQLNAVKDFDGEVVFIPGNHDWQQGGKKGVDFVKRQEDYIQKYLDRKVFKPNNGCPGPEEIELSDNLTLIVIDTQWWLHRYKKPKGEKDNCDLRTEEAFLAEFKELLKTNREKNVIVVGHHPLYSNGVHGGYSKFNDHVFPLTKMKKNFWFPLPVIGSVYPFYRSFFGNIQDIPNPKYQELKRELVLAMNEYDNVIYSAGHEHNLQYVKENRLHHIVSGSGSKLTGLRFNKKIDFGAIKKGFAKVDVFENGTVRLSFFDAENQQNDLLFQKELFQKQSKDFDLKLNSKPSYKGKYKTVVPDSTFAASKFKRLFFGNLNRDLWTLPIQVPYLDIHYYKGGLTPVGKGGGMQTLSLKMIGGDGYEYKLRGIRKSADFLVARDLRETIVQDIVYDGIAGSHPYASVAVPKLAKAAEIYYTEPTLVYIPKDSILGDYLDEFGGMFCLLEMHADDDMSDFDNLGNSDKVVNYHKAIKKIEENPEHQIDVEFTLRSRLFDILIGDWDRHDDQWRWATFEEKDKTIYRPIPRDRDQVFFQFDGLFMRLASSKWLLRKFQNFAEDTRDIEGLSFNARYFDRYFLNEADKETWVSEAQKLQELISDEEIENAIRDLPIEAYKYNGKELINTLKNRRKKLVEFASEYYESLAKEVDVRGTGKEDLFEITRRENGDVEVVIYERKKERKEEYYRRVFKKDETKEIRIYGIDNDDKYEIKGIARKSILVRIIASENKDHIIDQSQVGGFRKMTKIYDTKGKSNIEVGKEAKVKVMAAKDAYVYNRKAFEHDLLIPVPSIGVNPDDGFIFGPKLKFIKRGFKNQPYKYYHDFYINYMFKADGFNVNYENEYIDLLGKVDVGNKVEWNKPEVFQYYGEGNETELSRNEIGNSLVRIDYFTTTSRFSLTSKGGSSTLTTRFNFQTANPEKSNDNFLNTELNTSRQQFFKVGLLYKYKNIDSDVNPKKGMIFNVGLTQVNSLLNTDVNFFRFTSDLSLYIPINYFRKQTTLALRSGLSINDGRYLFYQSNFLSGLNEFRGITRNRFAGRKVSYSNIELRKSFMKVRNYVVPLDIGMLVHYDLGKVWVDRQESDLWHNSYGTGIYLNVLDFMTIVATYSISDVNKTFYLGTNFYF